MTIKRDLRNEAIFELRVLTILDGTTGTLNTPLNPISLSAEIAKYTKGIHGPQNWRGEELMRSGAMRIVTSPDDMAIKSA